MNTATATPSGAATSGLRDRRRIIAICCLSVLIGGVNVTIVNVALPSIQTSLHTSLSGLQWVIDAFNLTIASLLMFSGSMADRVGRRRVFQVGMGLFTVGSLLCSIAPGAPALILFRVVQAVGGSALNPVALAIISNSVTDRTERARALGIWGSALGLSLALGPVLGGLLVHAINWRAIFWVMVPFGLITMGLTQRFVPESRAERPRRVDPAGQILIMILIATLTAAIIEGQSRGWGSALIVALFAAAIAAAVTLVLVERRVREPLVDLRFFRSAPFSGATLIAVAAFGALSGFLFLNTLYLQDTRHDSALTAGLLTLPVAAVLAGVAPLSGRLVAARGARLPLVLAGATLTAGAVMLSFLTADTSMAFVIVAYVVLGFGLGMVNPPISNTAVSGMPAAEAGVAAAIASTGRQFGAALGVALVGTLVAGAGAGTPAGTTPAPWLFLAGLGVLTLAVGLLSTGRWAARTAQATARYITEDAG